MTQLHFTKAGWTWHATILLHARLSRYRSLCCLVITIIHVILFGAKANRRVKSTYGLRFSPGVVRGLAEVIFGAGIQRYCILLHVDYKDNVNVT